MIIFAISLGLFATALLVMLAMGFGKSTKANERLAALDQEFAPSNTDERVADIRRTQHKMSAIPWLNKWLTGMNFAVASSLYLYQAGMKTSIGKLLVISVAGTVFTAFFLFLYLGAIVPAALFSLGFLPLPFLYVRHRRASRLMKLEQQLPEALGMMVSALRVGHSMVASLGAVAQESAEPIAGEMRKCFDEQNYGIDLRTALTNLTNRAPVQDLRIFVAAVLIQKESGGNLAEVLEKVADTTRERFRLKKQVSVHTAQGRMTGWILSALPVVLGGGMYLVNPEGISILWTNPTGLKMLCGAGVMDVVGALIIRKIVAIQV